MVAVPLLQQSIEDWPLCHTVLRCAVQAPSAVYLPDAWDSWESFAGTGSGKGARLYQGPYSLAPIRPRPIMLDSAAGEWQSVPDAESHAGVPAVFQPPLGCSSVEDVWSCIPHPAWSGRVLPLVVLEPPSAASS